ncbi:MAG TPA: Gfo/Idh/MocA family oxidoreductase [Candidatus Ratteibacteria bacterium]|nr:Gfo/Idh/MocA family oxidoreductase [Candidatus Ratteibacteria bacterium]
MIGCGYVSRRHIEAIKSLEETELKTLCDVDISQAENFAQEFGNILSKMLKNLLKVENLVLFIGLLLLIVILLTL